MSKAAPTPSLVVLENTRGRQEHAEAGSSEKGADTGPRCIWDTRKWVQGLVNTSKDTRGHNSGREPRAAAHGYGAVWNKGASDSSCGAEMTAGLDVRALPSPLNTRGQACTIVLLLQEEPRRYSLEKAKGPRRS